MGDLPAIYVTEVDLAWPLGGSPYANVTLQCGSETRTVRIDRGDLVKLALSYARAGLPVEQWELRRYFQLPGVPSEE